MSGTEKKQDHEIKWLNWMKAGDQLRRQEADERQSFEEVG